MRMLRGSLVVMQTPIPPPPPIFARDTVMDFHREPPVPRAPR